MTMKDKLLWKFVFIEIGGPLMHYINVAPDKYRCYQFGIVSYGIPIGCDRTDIYTRVQYYIDWIQETIKEK